MKKITRILSVALVAMMLMSLCAIAQADDTTAYIPAKLGKLDLDAVLDDFEYPELTVKISNLAKKKVNGKYITADPDYCLDPAASDEAGEPVGYPRKWITEDSVAQLQFSEKPDWAGVVLSSLDGGWLNLDIDDDGYAEYEIGELHRQPGMWSWYASGDGWFAHGAGGDYPYSAGKDYGDYSVNVSYHRDGSAYKVKVTMKNAADPFLTGLEVEEVSVIFESVEVVTDCYALDLVEWENNGHMNSDGTHFVPRPQPMSVWYLSHVEAVYAEGAYIAGIGTDWRNDKKQNLASYRVAYAVSENAYYMITYSPRTTSIYENRSGSTTASADYGKDFDLTKGNTSGAFYKANIKITGTVTQVPEDYVDLGKQDVCAANIPSQKLENGDFVTHYKGDDPIFGLYYKSRDDWKNGNIYAVSGSGNNLKKWYQWNGSEKKNGIVHNNNGKQIKSIKKACTSFKSPRRLTK